ncbi:MAG: DUF1707 SHOCT-like domain-containing protein [Trebonia sp.]
MAMRYYAPFPGGGGEPPRLRGGPHALRIGDAERDAAAADLGEHYAAGRLTLDELNERLDVVFSSKTLGQLTRVMTDLPGPSRLPWRAGPGRTGADVRPGLGPRGGWGPAGFPYDGPFGMDHGQWHAADSSMARFQAREPRERPTSTDRAGRFAALALLMLAMLIWLFTALLFARHGLSHQVGPVGPPFSHSIHAYPGMNLNQP